MIDRVVVPVDFTPESDRALAVAAALADWAGATIGLVHLGEAVNRSYFVTQLADEAERIGGGATWRFVELTGPIGAALLAEAAGRGGAVVRRDPTRGVSSARCSSAA